MGDKMKPRRYVARPALRATLRDQGRQQGYLARALRVSEATMSRRISGDRLMDEADAWVVAALLGVGFDVLFELPNGSENVPVRAKTGHAEPVTAPS